MKIKRIRTTIIISSVAVAFVMPSATLAYAQEINQPTTVAYDENSDTETAPDQSNAAQMPEETEEQTGTQAGQASGFVNPDTGSYTQEMNVVPETDENAGVWSETKDSSGVGASGGFLMTADPVETDKEKNTEKEPDEKDKEKAPSDGWNSVDGKEIYYKDGKPFTGWIEEGKTKIYVREGKRLTGWLSEEGKYYYLNEGIPYTGWHKMGKSEGEKTSHWSYFGNDGVLRTGWVQFGKGTSEPDGKSAKHWSYFGTNGWLVTGWKYLTEKDGEKTSHWSYFGDNGWLVTGWKNFDKKDGEKTSHWSYFGYNGWLTTGWKYLNEKDGEKTSHWSYFGNNGWLRTGWVQFGKGTNEPDGNSSRHWSYFGNNGWLSTGWRYLSETDGEKTPHWSHFGDNGWLITGTKKIAGMTCTFNNAGWLRKYETLTPHYNQYAYNYLTGCGGVSRFMAMQYKGYLKNWSLPQFMSTMPYTSDGNPNNGFVGDPTVFHLTASNRGIYPAALAKWGARYGNVTDISGCSFDNMINEVRKGNPVVALATWNLSDYAITQYSWGKYRDENHHFFVLVGYDYDTDRYKVMDALISSGNGSKWVTGASFRKVWNGIKGAVLVR